MLLQHTRGQRLHPKGWSQASVLNLEEHVNGRKVLFLELISFLSFFDLDVVHNVRNNE
jgi:hypothetical protein